MEPDSRTRLRGAAGRYTEPRLQKLVQSDYVLDLTGEQVGRLRNEQPSRYRAARTRYRCRRVSADRGYYKASSRLLIGRLETDSERQTASRNMISGRPRLERAGDPIITSTPTNDGSGRAYGFDVFVSRTAPAVSRARVGSCHGAVPTMRATARLSV